MCPSYECMCCRTFPAATDLRSGASAAAAAQRRTAAAAAVGGGRPVRCAAVATRCRACKSGGDRRWHRRWAAAAEWRREASSGPGAQQGHGQKQGGLLPPSMHLKECRWHLRMVWINIQRHPMSNSLALIPPPKSATVAHMYDCSGARLCQNRSATASCMTSRSFFEQQLVAYKPPVTSQMLFTFLRRLTQPQTTAALLSLGALGRNFPTCFKEVYYVTALSSCLQAPVALRLVFHVAATF